MTLIRGFFFDLDGTLVDTYRADYVVYRKAILEVTGVDVSAADFAKTHGMEMRVKLERLTPGLDETAIRRVGELKRQYFPRYLHLTKPNTQLISFLATHAPHHTMALVTTGKRQNAMTVLESHHIAKYFTATVFGDEVSHHKPHPAPYLLALERTGLRPEEVVAFEDSPAGIQAATDAGLKVVRIQGFVT